MYYTDTHTRISSSLSFFFFVSFYFIFYYFGWVARPLFADFSFLLYFFPREEEEEEKKGKLRRVEESITSRDHRETHRKLMRLGSPFQSSCRKKDDGVKKEKKKEGIRSCAIYTQSSFLDFFRGFFGDLFFFGGWLYKTGKRRRKIYKTGKGKKQVDGYLNDGRFIFTRTFCRERSQGPAKRHFGRPIKAPRTLGPCVHRSCAQASDGGETVTGPSK